MNVPKVFLFRSIFLPQHIDTHSIEKTCHECNEVSPMTDRDTKGDWCGEKLQMNFLPHVYFITYHHIHYFSFTLLRYMFPDCFHQYFVFSQALHGSDQNISESQSVECWKTINTVLAAERLIVYIKSLIK
jgi:hypothetical protein